MQSAFSGFNPKRTATWKEAVIAPFKQSYKL